eukprot:TRINITY_DN33591_c0_g1_i1.p1 TRINITY_DN33591_c0_g1~~TRINITY_DN33591_c0_g1_i1.p1  ORF type:complete len:300 (+),score=33.51 TRINITY_DN33591_c0_g1_i1:64-963(+)
MAKARSSSGSNGDVGARFLCSSGAACIAEMFTFPIDTTRVRMQVVGTQKTGTKLGMFGTAKEVFKSQGIKAFYSGIPPAMIRQFVQCGVNLAAYLPIRNALGADKDHSFVKKGLAGAMSGAFGQFCAIPADIVKVRMQADNKTALQGGKPRYQSTSHAFKSIYQETGVTGLWRGATPSCGRSAAIHSTGLASYDSFKYILVSKTSLAADSSATHLLASSASGFLASAVGCPFDVIKTRVMNHTNHISPYQMVRMTLQNEGATALFKGFVPTLARLGPWQVMWLSFYERFCIIYTGDSKF